MVRKFYESIQLKKYLLCFLFISISLFSEDGIIVDYYFSPYMGAYDLVTSQRYTQAIDPVLFKRRDEPKKGVMPIIGRFAYLFAFWDPLNLFLTTVQHEVFGHGFRLRTLSQASAVGYSFKWPFPYGDGGGATNYDISNKYTLGDNALVAIAGIEAEYVLAKKMKIDTLYAQTINPFEISLYQNAQQSLLLYSIATHLGDISVKNVAETPFEGNDIKSYVATINLMFPNSHLSLSKVEGLAFLNLLDPMTFYNIYAWWLYVFTGKSFTPPVISFGEVKYLPNFKFSLAPYGLEYGLENYFILPGSKPLMAYVKAGGYANNFYMGAGVEFYKAITVEKLSLGFKGDVWFQPSLSGSAPIIEVDEAKEKPTSNDLQKKLVGIALSAIGQYEIGHKGLNVFLELGGKSKGYLPGYDYAAFPTIRAGLTGRF